MNTWLSTFRIWMIWKYNMNIYNRTFKSTVFPSSGVFITNADFEYLCYNSHLSLVFSFKQFIIYPSFLSMAWQIYSRTCTAMFSFRLFFAIVLYMYRHNSNIRHIKSENLSDCLLVLQLPWVDWSQVENEDVVGAAPTGNAPTTSEWSTILLPTQTCLILETWRYVISPMFWGTHVYFRIGFEHDHKLRPAIFHHTTFLWFGRSDSDFPRLVDLFW